MNVFIAQNRYMP